MMNVGMMNVEMNVWVERELTCILYPTSNLTASLYNADNRFTVSLVAVYAV